MRTINPVNHKKLIIDVLTMAGLTTEQAVTASTVMAYADQRGIDSHGMILLNTYVERIEKQIIKKKPSYTWELNKGVIALLDGDLGMGHYIGDIAMKKAIQLAKEHTIGLVFVKNTSHYGASGYYTELAAKEDMIGFSTTNTLPLMAPTGGAERVLGNNPISFSIPREAENPIILDIASSVVAAGKLMVAEQKKQEIPLDWALDIDGNPTTDPYAGFKGGGSLIPLGNHKGYGLSLIMDVLAGILTGAGYGKNVGHSDIGFVMMAINTSAVMDKNKYNTRLNDLTGMVKDSKKAKGTDNIYLPGEIEYLNQKTRLAQGIPVNKNLYTELEKLTAKLGLNMNDYFTVQQMDSSIV
ncbi:Ldh family oxidoreductase [Sporosarcina sp. FSL K6-1522]|uniref:Ldh family oxidoreductase n=1 Tax=Sporosarcina sp. FSL K6-1522 TaxID=2921554 RepID=UPI00315AFE4C